MFTARFINHPRKFLRKIPTPDYKRIIKALTQLQEDPFPHKVKRVKSKTDKTFRVRVGDYRIQYQVFHEKEEIIVTVIDKRERAY